MCTTTITSTMIVMVHLDRCGLGRRMRQLIRMVTICTARRARRFAATLRHVHGHRTIAVHHTDTGGGVHHVARGRTIDGRDVGVHLNRERVLRGGCDIHGRGVRTGRRGGQRQWRSGRRHAETHRGAIWRRASEWVNRISSTIVEFIVRYGDARK